MEALGIDTKLLISQIINFALFFYVFKRFISKPFFGYLKKQKEQEHERERVMEELQKQEEMRAKEEKQILAKARSTAQEIVGDAKKTAKRTRDEIVKSAHDDAAAIRQKADSYLEDERTKMYREIKDRVISTSEKLARSALSRFIDQEKQSDILKGIFKKIDTKDLYEN